MCGINSTVRRSRRRKRRWRRWRRRKCNKSFRREVWSFLSLSLFLDVYVHNTQQSSSVCMPSIAVFDVHCTVQYASRSIAHREVRRVVISALICTASQKKCNQAQACKLAWLGTLISLIRYSCYCCCCCCCCCCSSRKTSCMQTACL